MSTMTRTTIAIDAGLLRTAKARASRQGCTLGQYITQAVQREVIHGDASRSEPVSVVLPTAEGGLPNPAIDWTSNASILGVLDEADLREGRLPRC